MGWTTGLRSVWEMVLEGSTGHSGSFARQVTLNESTVDEPLTNDLLDALETSCSEGGVVLQVEGVFFKNDQAIPVMFQFADGYKSVEGEQSYSRAKLLEMAAEGISSALLQDAMEKMLTMITSTCTLDPWPNPFSAWETKISRARR